MSDKKTLLIVEDEPEVLELLQDANDLCCYSTYSHWADDQALEDYRNSELFKSTWAATKIHFDRKPEAVTWHRPFSYS